MKRFYIHATGSSCYDAGGLTWPYKKSFNFVEVVRQFKGLNPRWRRHLDYSNLPKVLCFSMWPTEVEHLNKFLNERCAPCFIVRELWR